MNYIEILIKVCPCEDYITDLLSSHLGEIGFESFEEHQEGVVAYIREDAWNELLFQELISNFRYADITEFKQKLIKQINWNEEWEKHYFEPIIIGDECVIHSTFHANIPDSKYQIIIDPKMSFGTGHHETTTLMIEKILKMDLTGKKVLDMGCGTAVLAIIASMRGAENVVAIDIDPWCIENSNENVQKNKIENINIQLGGAEILGNDLFDVIIANINRNILLEDIKKYSTVLLTGGVLLLSGFYVEDISVIKEELIKYQLHFIDYHQKNNWAIVTAHQMA